MPVDVLRRVDGGHDGLFQVLEALNVVTAHGMGADDLDVGHLLFEGQAHAHEGAAGAQRRHEVVEPTSGLGQDLLRCGLVMGQAVVVVGELIRHEVLVGKLAHHLARLQDGPVGAQLGVGEGHLGAEGLDHLAPLDGHRLAHHDHERIPFDRGDHGQSDTGVAAGRLENSLAGRQRTLALGLLDHLECNAILDAAGGVEALQLGENFHPRIGVEPVDLHHRRAAD